MLGNRARGSLSSCQLQLRNRYCRPRAEVSWEVPCRTLIPLLLLQRSRLRSWRSNHFPLNISFTSKMHLGPCMCLTKCLAFWEGVGLN